MPSSGALRKVKAATAAEVCERWEVPSEARALLKPSATPREYLDALVAARQLRAAIGFLAHALPPREAVWWGALCVKHVSPGALPAPETDALRAAVTWVLDPTEPNREAAKGPGEKAGIATPAGALATAASWTGGTLAPPLPRVAPVVPGPWLPAKAVAGAVVLASTKGGGGLEETQARFLELGSGIAEGRISWPDVKPRAAGRTWGF